MVLIGTSQLGTTLIAVIATMSAAVAVLTTLVAINVPTCRNWSVLYHTYQRSVQEL
jgi:hypothetical protein